MKYRIRYREYDVDDNQGGLVEFLEVTEAEFFKIENGFVVAWLEDNETRIPDIYINANNVLTIEPF